MPADERCQEFVDCVVDYFIDDGCLFVKTADSKLRIYLVARFYTSSDGTSQREFSKTDAVMY
jgi:hypothetical protein